MNRCPTSPIALKTIATHALLAGASGLFSLSAWAQNPIPQTQNEAALGGRNFPINTLRGKMVITGFPEMQLDGVAERLAPGARIRNTQNMIVQPATITGQYLAVNYRRDAAGLVSDVWILTPTEASADRAQLNKPFLNFWPFVSSAENEAR
ncbi:Uncharacterised protein [Xylophilus ampelinus]|nr:hypothetical protein [Variovorax sp.]VTY34784.1 Uncharacterised protein [Xylophilus ampelinus]